MIDPEIRDLKVEWVKLPGAMPGMRHLHIATTHGDNSVTEFWLTEKQGQAVGQFARTAREAKLIADTRLEVVEYCEQRIKECAAIRHGEKPAPHSTGHAIYFDQEKNRFEESFAIKFRDAILALTPAQIAAQAEERDRRVVEEALKEYEDDFIHIAEYWNGNENDRAVADALWEMRETAEKALKRIASLRAAVQPGG